MVAVAADGHTIVIIMVCVCYIILWYGMVLIGIIIFMVQYGNILQNCGVQYQTLRGKNNCMVWYRTPYISYYLSSSDKVIVT